MVAIGIIIFTGQIYVALGLVAGPGSTVENLLGLFEKLPDFNPVITLIAVIGLILLPRINSRLLHFFPPSQWLLILSLPVVYICNFFEPHTLHLLSHDYEVGPSFFSAS